MTDTDLVLEEMIRNAQKQPGVADVMAFYAQYSKLLQMNNECTIVMAPQGISSYSSNSS